MKKYPFYEVEDSIYYSEEFNNIIPGSGVEFTDWFQQYNITIDRKPLFNPFLAFVLTEENIPATRCDEQGKLKGVFTLGPQFWQSYADGFFRGEKDFHLMALHNSKVYLTEQYDKEWSMYESKVPLRISHEVVEEYGYYAAHIAGVLNLGLIKAHSPKNLTALQYAALLWYNGIKTLSSGNKYQEIKNLKAQYKFCESSEKKIFDQHSVWRDGNYRAGKGFNNQARAYVAGVYSILEPFDLSDREEYYTDREAFRRNAPIKKT